MRSDYAKSPPRQADSRPTLRDSPERRGKGNLKMAIVHENLQRRVHHRGHVAYTKYPWTSPGWEVFVGETKIGEFVFSDGHNGYAGYSNSFGVDCYRLIERCGECAWHTGPLYHSRRSVVIGLIDAAIDRGLI